MSSNYNMMKLIFDPKIEAILYSVKDKQKTVKEIATELNDKSSRLYYPIQKLLKMELIKVSEEKQVGNLIEKYYTSRHLFSNDEVIRLEGELASKNFEFFLSHILLSVNKGLSLLESDLTEAKDRTIQEESRAIYSEMTASLTNDEWIKVNEEIQKLISSRSELDKTDTKEYTFSILTYEDDTKATNK